LQEEDERVISGSAKKFTRKTYFKASKDRFSRIFKDQALHLHVHKDERTTYKETFKPHAYVHKYC